MSEESLLAPSAEDTATDSVQPDGQPWNWHDDLPGTGDRPEWFRGDKYANVAEQAKAYTELEGKFGSFTGSPEEYEIPEAQFFAKDIDLPEGVDFNLNAEDPLLKHSCL